MQAGRQWCQDRLWHSDDWSWLSTFPWRNVIWFYRGLWPRWGKSTKVLSIISDDELPSISTMTQCPLPTINVESGIVMVKFPFWGLSKALQLHFPDHTKNTFNLIAIDWWVQEQDSMKTADYCERWCHFFKVELWTVSILWFVMCNYK